MPKVICKCKNVLPKKSVSYINYLYSFIIYLKEQYTAVFQVLLEEFTIPNTAINTDSFLTCLEEQQNGQVPQNQSNLELEFQVSFITSPHYSSKLCIR